MEHTVGQFSQSRGDGNLAEDAAGCGDGRDGAGARHAGGCVVQDAHRSSDRGQLLPYFPNLHLA